MKKVYICLVIVLTLLFSCVPVFADGGVTYVYPANSTSYTKTFSSASKVSASVLSELALDLYYDEGSCVTAENLLAYNVAIMGVKFKSVSGKYCIMVLDQFDNEHYVGYYVGSAFHVYWSDTHPGDIDSVFNAIELVLQKIHAALSEDGFLDSHLKWLSTLSENIEETVGKISAQLTTANNRLLTANEYLDDLVVAVGELSSFTPVVNKLDSVIDALGNLSGSGGSLNVDFSPVVAELDGLLEYVQRIVTKLESGTLDTGPLAELLEDIHYQLSYSDIKDGNGFPSTLVDYVMLGGQWLESISLDTDYLSLIYSSSSSAVDKLTGIGTQLTTVNTKLDALIAANTKCEHTYARSTLIAATCDMPGVDKYTCSKCGDFYYEDTAASGHVWQTTGVGGIKTETVLERATYEVDLDFGIVGCEFNEKLQAGDVYIVDFDGTKYECVAYRIVEVGKEGIVLIGTGRFHGGLSTSEPFVLAYDYDEQRFTTSAIVGKRSCSLGIERVTGVYREQVELFQETALTFSGGLYSSTGLILVPGESYTVLLNGVSYDYICGIWTAEGAPDMYGVGDLGGLVSGDPANFLIFYHPDTGTWDLGFSDESVTSATLAIYHNKRTESGFAIRSCARCGDGENVAIIAQMLDQVVAAVEGIDVTVEGSVTNVDMSPVVSMLDSIHVTDMLNHTEIMGKLDAVIQAVSSSTVAIDLAPIVSALDDIKAADLLSHGEVITKLDALIDGIGDLSGGDTSVDIDFTTVNVGLGNLITAVNDISVKLDTLVPEECNHGYVYSTQVSAPTCELPGVNKFTCGYCRYSYYEVLGSAGHNWVSHGGDYTGEVICNDSYKYNSMDGGYGVTLTENLIPGDRYAVVVNGKEYVCTAVEATSYDGSEYLLHLANFDFSSLVDLTSMPADGFILMNHFDLGSWLFADFGGMCSLSITHIIDDYEPVLVYDGQVTLDEDGLSQFLDFELIPGENYVVEFMGQSREVTCGLMQVDMADEPVILPFFGDLSYMCAGSMNGQTAVFAPPFAGMSIPGKLYHMERVDAGGDSSSYSVRTCTRCGAGENFASLMEQLAAIENALSNVGGDVINIENNTNIDITEDNDNYNIFYVEDPDGGDDQSIIDLSGDALTVFGKLLNFLYQVGFKDALEGAGPGIGALSDFYLDDAEGSVDLWAS